MQVRSRMVDKLAFQINGFERIASEVVTTRNRLEKTADGKSWCKFVVKSTLDNSKAYCLSLPLTSGRNIIT